ncbi:MAG: preprotein translocase subunit YajC [Candidatus Omnitrophica bacterium]|nr:preprotein translocase subunit YajC [Candidatus Omnitrophota bacterium]
MMNPGAAQPNAIASLMPIIFIFGIFYFLLIRPQQKKQKEHEKMVQELKKNEEVVTNGGIHGTVVNVKDTTLILRIDENVKIEIDKKTIAYLKKSR